MDTPEIEQPIILDDTTKITFDAAQQQLIDRLIRESQGKAAQQVRRELADTKKELELLRTKTVGNQVDSSEVEKLRAQVADSALRAADAEQRATAQSKAILQ